jgi:polar amino acid transport system substrate-binding protein
MTRPALLSAVAIALAAVAVTGCGSTHDTALDRSLAAIATPVATPAPAAPATPAGHCRNLTASLRPPATLPSPGQFPSGSLMERIRRRGRLVAGVDQNTLLFSYRNPLDGRIEGFEIDVLRRLARALLGNPNAIEFKAVTTAQRLPFVQQGKVDVVADAVTITCDRKRQVDFSSVYYDAAQRLLVPAGSPIHSSADLADRRVCATQGSTSLQTLQTVASSARPFPVAQRTDCLVALQEDRVDAVTSDDAILLGFRAQDPYTRIVGPALAREPYGLAISKRHPEFVRFVNGVLANMRADGAWRAIHRRWLGRFVPAPRPPRARYVS